MILVNRDYLILKEIGRWKIVLGRHIRELAGFTGIRACDRRLKLLIDNGYIKRKKVLYGFPYVYTLTHKSKMLLNLNKREDSIRIDLLRHDITVLDVVISLIKQKGLKLNDFITEKELNSLDGFGIRRHRPDFLILDSEEKERTEKTEKRKNEKIAVEVELTLKSFDKLEKNVKDNFMNFSKQLWFVEFVNLKLLNNLNQLKEKYPNFYILNVLTLLKNDEDKNNEKG